MPLAAPRGAVKRTAYEAKFNGLRSERRYGLPEGDGGAGPADIEGDYSLDALTSYTERDLVAFLYSDSYAWWR